jgi:hypothetical protein
MPITNESKPTTSLTNPTKVVNYETWDSNTTTWDTETRTWDEMGTIWSNTAKPGTLIWLSTLFPWLMITPWIGTDSEITNIAKP